MAMERIALFNDSYQNWKGYEVPKAQLILTDIPYQCFFIETERFYRNAEGEDVKETSRFICEGFGVFTEEKFRKNMIQDRGIRIVGRLKQYKIEVPYTCVVCEHIEFKPIKK